MPMHQPPFGSITAIDLGDAQRPVLVWWTANLAAGANPTGAEYLAEFNRRTRSSLPREQWVRVRRDDRACRDTADRAQAARPVRHRDAHEQ